MSLLYLRRVSSSKVSLVTFVAIRYVSFSRKKLLVMISKLWFQRKGQGKVVRKWSKSGQKVVRGVFMRNSKCSRG